MIQVLKKFLLNPWFQLAFSVLCVTASEVFLKRGAVEAPHSATRNREASSPRTSGRVQMACHCVGTK